MCDPEAGIDFVSHFDFLSGEVPTPAAGAVGNGMDGAVRANETLDSIYKLGLLSGACGRYLH
jgi:hypothetical protein